MSNPNDIITIARNFLKEKINSLRKDSYHCLFKDHPAPFPVLLYCFSVIDLLGSLYAGNSKNDSPVAKQSKAYMIEIMKYPNNVADLLQKVFRHKLVHLAQPNPCTEYCSKKYFWYLCHESNRDIHLKIDQTDKNNEYWFKISVWDFVQDIDDSVFSPNGYMDLLTRNIGETQKNFVEAFKNIK